MVPPVPDWLWTVSRVCDRLRSRGALVFEGGTDWSLAVGQAARLTATSRTVRLSTASTQRSWPWTPAVMAQIPDVLDSLGIDGWRAYGWCGFGLGVMLYGGAPRDPEAVEVQLTIPQAEVRRSPDGLLLRALAPADLDLLERLVCSSGAGIDPAARKYPDGDPFAITSDHRSEHEAAVAAGVTRIATGPLQKVVLSRELPLPGPVDIFATYRAARTHTRCTRSFAFSLDGFEAAGMSPESVLHSAGDGVVTSELVAGTRALTGVAATDRRLARELFDDPKEILEHAVSVRDTVTQLRTVCAPDSLTVKPFMDVARFGGVQHLESAVTGRLAAGSSAWTALAALFPAIALTGSPRNEAITTIRQLEATERGLFGGSVVSLDVSGAVDSAVVLRTVFQREGRAFLRAGGGIVAGSQPSREFEETCEKLRGVAAHVVTEKVDGRRP
nr:salicylate synthase [Kribbella italica]